MTSKERVLRTINFENPDRIPRDLWILPAARIKYGAALEALLQEHECDIASVSSFMDMAFDPINYTLGTHVDEWGSEWLVLQEGMIGEVKQPVFAHSVPVGYVPPTAMFEEGFDANRSALQQQIKTLRQSDKFIIGGWVSVFERMQFLRGTEELYCDIALRSDEFYAIRELVRQYYLSYVDRWLQMDIDAVAFGDDWGTQISMLISREAWIELFKPVYKELIDRIIAAGKVVFFHSDGYIYEIYDQLIELGVKAVNSQIWCMGVEKVAEFAGKITFWGEISRQTTLPEGTPEEVAQCAAQMKQHLYKNGGLIGESEINSDVPLANIEAVLQCW